MKRARQIFPNYLYREVQLYKRFNLIGTTIIVSIFFATGCTPKYPVCKIDEPCRDIPGYCTRNAECSNGQVCRKHRCGPCVVNDDCGEGIVCMSGICEKPECQIDKDCPASQFCFNDHCEETAEEKACGPPLPVSGQQEIRDLPQTARACTHDVEQFIMEWSEQNSLTITRRYITMNALDIELEPPKVKSGSEHLIDQNSDWANYASVFSVVSYLRITYSHRPRSEYSITIGAVDNYQLTYEHGELLHGLHRQLQDAALCTPY